MTISVGNLIVAGGATVDTSEVLSALNKQGLKVWVGTTSQRDALPENIKNDDKITFLTYDSEEDIYLIVDTIISYSKTWSSVKISTELAKKINSSDVYTKTEVMSLINAKVASALKYRGAVATVAALPSSGQENGDSYYVQADGYMYAWSSDYSDWQALGSATDMTNYYTKSEVDAIAADLAVKFQFTTMPTADSTTVGQIIQYIGADTQDYKNGYWYKGIDNGDSTYSWSLHSVGDYYTKSEIDGNFSKSRDMVASSSSVQSLQALLDEVHPELWAPDTYQGSLIINGWGVGTYQATITDNASANHKVVITGTFSTATDGARPFVATYTSSNVWNIIYTALVSYVDTKISNTVTKHNYSVAGTSDVIADTKALVSHIATLDVGTYAGEFKRTGITFGSYRLTYFIDGIYAKSVSGIVTYSISVGTDATYQVSYVEDIEHGTPPVWKIEKLSTDNGCLSYEINSGANVDFLQAMEQQPLSKVSFIRIITTNGTNTPDGHADVDFYVWVMKLESSGFIRAVAYNIRNNTIYTISNVSGVWGSWQPLSPINTITAGSTAPVMSGTVYDQLVQKAQTVVNDIVSQSAGAYSSLVRRGNIVQCIVRFNTEAAFAWSTNTKIGTIPQGYRPAVFQPCPTMNYQSAGTTFTFVSVDTNGDIVCIPLSGDRLDLYINLTWYTEDV